MKMKLLTATAVLMSIGLTAHAQNLISNGGLESFTASGTPPLGEPTGFSGGNVIQTTGINSTYAAIIEGSTAAGGGGNVGNHPLTQNVTSVQPTNFAVSFNLASAAVSNRSFQLLVANGGQQPINLIVVNGTVTGMLSLQAYETNAFVPILPNAFKAGTFNSTSGTFTNLTTNNEYLVTLTGNLAAGGTGSTALSYAVSSVALDGSQAFSSGPITAGYQTNTGAGITQVSFAGGNANTDSYLLDNISVTAIPEPNTWVMGVGLAGLLLVYSLRRASC